MNDALIITTSTTNPGDIIQNIAIAQYLPHNPPHLNRDQLYNYNGPPIYTIINGFYLKPPHPPPYWPPAPNIHPLYLGYHAHNHELVKPHHQSHYQTHQPIGCRDKTTARKLARNNIQTTLTLCPVLTLIHPGHHRGTQTLTIGLPPKLQAQLPNHLNHQELPYTHPANWPYHQKLEHTAHILKAIATAKLIITTHLHAALTAIAYSTPHILIIGHTLHHNRSSGYRAITNQYSINNLHTIPKEIPPTPRPQHKINQLHGWITHWLKHHTNPLPPNPTPFN